MNNRVQRTSFYRAPRWERATVQEDEAGPGEGATMSSKPAHFLMRSSFRTNHQKQSWWRNTSTREPCSSPRKQQNLAASATQLWSWGQRKGGLEFASESKESCRGQACGMIGGPQRPLCEAAKVKPGLTTLKTPKYWTLEPWDACRGEPTQETEVCYSQQNWKELEIWRAFWHQTWDSKFARMVFSLALVQYFLTMPPFLYFGMVIYIPCYYVLELWDLLFFFWCNRRLQLRDCVNLRRDFELLNIIEIVINYGTLEVGQNAFSNYDIVTSVWGTRKLNVVVWKKMAPKDSGANH